MPKNGREATSKASVHDMMTLIKQALSENFAFGLTKKNDGYVSVSRKK